MVKFANTQNDVFSAVERKFVHAALKNRLQTGKELFLWSDFLQKIWTRFFPPF